LITSHLFFNWLWINTLYIPFLGGWTSINPSYFDVNYRGTIGFDTLPIVAATHVLAKSSWSNAAKSQGPLLWKTRRSGTGRRRLGRSTSHPHTVYTPIIYNCMI
jgi:hypothetical protein